MSNPQVSNPNDFKVVEFHNSEDFTFTPEMGCMYDGRPISGITGAPGINGGESMTLPYRIGNQLALNLAKVVMTRKSSTVPQLDAQGQPITAAIWDDVKLASLKASYLKELYSEAKPVAMSETDRLMARVEELNKLVMENISTKVEASKEPEVITSILDGNAPSTSVVPKVYLDKAEVIAELEKRAIVHDKRKNKAELEKLLA